MRVISYIVEESVIVWMDFEPEIIDRIFSINNQVPIKIIRDAIAIFVLLWDYKKNNRCRLPVNWTGFTSDDLKSYKITFTKESFKSFEDFIENNKEFLISADLVVHNALRNYFYCLGNSDKGIYKLQLNNPEADAYIKLADV